jgi:lipoate-protein ligase A
MIFIDNEQNYDPYLNLALEEYLMRNVRPDDDILLFYINAPSIIIGRNQNTLEEINQTYVREHDIKVVRRLSGGGAVYHDLGNLNFSFITPNIKENVHNFRKFTEPVVQVLREMGVPAEVGGRNDILADGRKISGNAQYIAAQRMVSHGTLLFDTDLSQVAEALNVKMSKIESKGIKSVRSRVANISEFLTETMTTEEFRARVLRGLFGGVDDFEQHALTAQDWQAARDLSEERYRQWEWNYGGSPAYNVQKTHRFPIGEVDARIDVQRGIISGITFFGDFFGREDVSALAALLVGVRYDEQHLAQALAGADVGQYFTGVTNEEFLAFLY